MNHLSSLAISHIAFGNPAEVLSLVKTAIPKIKSNEILVRLKARPINPSDLLAIQGIGPYQRSIKLPAIAGFEGFGIAVDKGLGVASQILGSRVVSMKMTHSWQEYINLPIEETILIPTEISDNEAAQICINPLTAWLIINQYHLREGDIVIGNAANSTMGKLFAQFAKMIGYRFIGIVRKNIYLESLMKLGADLIVNCEDKNINEQILSYTGGKKPNIGLDAIGGSAGECLGRALAPGSQMILYGSLSLSPFSPRILQYFHEHKINLFQFHLRNWIHSETLLKRKNIFNILLDTMIKYQISLPIEKQFNLQNFKDALIRNRQPRNGKIILTN